VSATQAEHAEKLWDKIRHVRIGMLTTGGAGGRLEPAHGHPADHPAGALRVFTSQESAVAAALRAGAMAHVAMAEPADSLYVSISGRASLVNNG
jgi:general stress protein 26